MSVTISVPDDDLVPPEIVSTVFYSATVNDSLAILVAEMAFPSRPDLLEAKVGILVAAVAAGSVGATVLTAAKRGSASMP